MSGFSQALLIKADIEDAEAPREGWLFDATRTIQIGRSGANDLILNNPQVSRSHASVFFDGRNWQYSSFGTNGSFVNDVGVKNAILEDGMQIRLGGKSGAILSFELRSSDRENGSMGSVTFHLEGMKAGDEESTQAIWGRCFLMIARIAQQQMSGANKRMADDEDVAASVFASLFFGAVDGKFPNVQDRDSLWRLIVVMTRRKAADYIAHEKRLKRGGGNVRGDSIAPGEESTVIGPSIFDTFVSKDPTPDSIAIVEEETAHLLSLLPDDEHRAIALLRLQGMTNEEIAEELTSSVRTVERRVKQIRVNWEHALSTHSE